jgi:hypothetical protein
MSDLEEEEEEEAPSSEVRVSSSLPAQHLALAPEPAHEPEPAVGVVAERRRSLRGWADLDPVAPRRPCRTWRRRRRRRPRPRRSGCRPASRRSTAPERLSLCLRLRLRLSLRMSLSLLLVLLLSGGDRCGVGRAGASVHAQHGAQPPNGMLHGSSVAASGPGQAQQGRRRRDGVRVNRRLRSERLRWLLVRARSLILCATTTTT